MICIIGGTGGVGRHLVSELSRRNIKFRCLVRNELGAREQLGADVDLVRANLDDSGSLLAAMQGCKRLFLLTGPHQSQSSQQISAIHAAKRAGVQHVVKLSAIDALVDRQSPAQIGREHWNAEEYLKCSGMAWTMLRPGFFMQNFCDMAQLVKELGMIAMPAPGSARTAMIDVRDIALAAANALTGEGHEGNCYTLPGKAHRLDAFPSLLSERLGKTVSYVEMTDDVARENMRSAGMEGWMISQQLELFGLIRDGAVVADKDDFDHIGQKSYRSLSDFARDQSHLFEPSSAR